MDARACISYHVGVVEFSRPQQLLASAFVPKQAQPCSVPQGEHGKIVEIEMQPWSGTNFGVVAQTVTPTSFIISLRHTRWVIEQALVPADGFLVSEIFNDQLICQEKR